MTIRSGLGKASFLATGAALGILIFTASALADPALRLTSVWARATVPGQRVAAAYMDVEADQPLVLTKVESPLAETVQIHTMLMEDGIMKMRERESLDLPKGKTVKLAPGGTHLMLFGLKERLLEGKVVPLTLTVMNAAGNRETVEISAPVKQAPVQ